MRKRYQGIFQKRQLFDFLMDDVAWPLHSSHLCPSDFVTWGHLKGKVFKHHPQTLEELKKIIHEEITEISHGVLARLMEHYLE